MSEKRTVFEKEYDGESIVDIEQDISEAWGDMEDIPDDQGIMLGKFTVTITWEPEKE